MATDKLTPESPVVRLYAALESITPGGHAEAQLSLYYSETAIGDFASEHAALNPEAQP